MHPGDWNAPVLRLPYRGAPQTIGVMREAALKSQHDPTVRQLVEHVCVGLPSKAYLDEYLAWYYFVLTHTRYMRDPRTVELVKSPHVVARQIMGGFVPSLDCDDMSALICSGVLALGGSCRLSTVAFRDLFFGSARQYTHVFAQAREPQSGAFVTLDPVAADRTREMLARVKAIKLWPVA